MTYEHEQELEFVVRKLIHDKICSNYKEIQLLESKKAVDIVICRNGSKPSLFFLEIKYHKHDHGRLGFGGRGGVGFQPEIISQRPKYFETNLRWIIASEKYPKTGILFLPTLVLEQYIAGGEVGKKFNNFQTRIFKEQKGFTENGLIHEIFKWIQDN